MNEFGICSCCGKQLKIFYDNKCQKCYREKVREKKTNQKLYSTYKGNSEKITKILTLYMQGKMTIKEIAKIVGYEYSNAVKVITKYIVKEGV